MRLGRFAYASQAVNMAVGLLILAGWISVSAAAQTKASSAARTNAETTSRAEDGHPNLNGIWKSTGQETFYLVKNGNKVQYLQRNSEPALEDDPDLTKTRALRQVNNQERRAESYKKNPNLMPSYKPELLAKVHDLDVHENEVDPAFHCYPSGVPRVGAPRQIVQTPGLILFLYMSENGAPYRVIPTDGRPHRTDVEPSYMGDSIGHWEGDTLVVDVNRFNDETWLGNDGWFHSTKMHVVERFTREGDNLRYQVTVEDSEVFTKPWVKNATVYKLSTDPADMISDATSIEAPCVEVDSGHIVNHDHL
jgi:hypothetical protein